MSGTTICLLRSTDTGAPTLTGQAGVLIALLDACLKDGYNSKTPSSITRSGSTATFTYAAAHGYAVDGLTKIVSSGCDQAEYNGIFQISNVSTLSFDVTVTGTPATPATGTLNTKVAPLGWGKPFSGTNKGAYRSNEITGTRLYLRVDDNNPVADTYKTAFCRGYETMTDVDSGTNLFPLVSQMANGIYLTKSYESNSTARKWILVGDGYEFLLFTAHYTVAFENCFNTFHFGDPASEMASDPFGCLIYGSTVAETYPSGGEYNSIATTLAGQAGHYFARRYTQIGTASVASKHGNYTLGGVGFGASALLSYPSPANNGLYVSSVYVCDSSVMRGQLKPLWQPLHVRPLGHGVLLPTNVSPINRRLYTIQTSKSWSGEAFGGETHIDIDGPWR